MNIVKLLLSMSLVAFFNSCSPVMSPAIEIKNSSHNGELIKNIKVNWNGYNLLSVHRPTTKCGGFEQNFALQKQSHIYGPVHVEWENAQGKKLTKKFTFKKEDFPTFRRGPFIPYAYHYIVLYFDQNDMQYYASDNPRIKKIRKEKSDGWIVHIGKCVKESDIVKL